MMRECTSVCQTPAGGPCRIVLQVRPSLGPPLERRVGLGAINYTDEQCLQEEGKKGPLCVAALCRYKRVSGLALEERESVLPTLGPPYTGQVTPTPSVLPVFIHVVWPSFHWAHPKAVGGHMLPCCSRAALPKPPTAQQPTGQHLSGGRGVVGTVHNGGPCPGLQGKAIDTPPTTVRHHPAPPPGSCSLPGAPQHPCPARAVQAPALLSTLGLQPSFNRSNRATTDDALSPPVSQ